LIVKAYTEWALKQHLCGRHETIHVVDMTFEKDTDFLLFTQNALCLLQRTDPRRYRTIVREVRYIVNSRIKGGGSYQRKNRRVSVNYKLYMAERSQPDYDIHLAAYACMLVHEATHGRLFTFGIPYNEQTWERCEGLCRREEKRFTSRLHLEDYDSSKLVSGVNQEFYVSMRNMSLMAKVKAIINIIYEFSRRKTS